MKFGNIVSLDFFGTSVLGVIIEEDEKNQGVSDDYFILARTNLIDSEDNINNLKQISFNEILEFNTSSRLEKDLTFICKHPETEDVQKVLNHYLEKYKDVKAVDFTVDISQTDKSKLNNIQKFSILNVAKIKGVYDAISGILEPVEA